jgi:hypothetical protein
MKKRWIAIVAVVCAVPLLLPANPISQYDYPVISEVQWIDSSQWSIELNNAMWFSVKRSCTTDVIKLYIASSKKNYSTRIYFNDSGLGVLTRSSLTEIPQAQPVTIGKIDTIFIPDPEAADAQYPNKGWKCPINNPKTGYSLIGVEGGGFVQSSRTSMGTKGNYTTIHHLHLIDRDGRPIPNVHAYSKSIHSDMGIYPTYIYYYGKGTSDTNGVMTLSAGIGGGWGVYLTDLVLAYSYALRPDINVNYAKFDPVYPGWSCGYIDTAVERNDTLMIKPNYQKVTVVDNEGTPYPDLTPRSLAALVGTCIGPGVYVVRLFPKSGAYTIDFYRNTDNVIVAACTCSYVDTCDTLCKTVVAASTGAVRAPAQAFSGNASRVAFSVLGSASGGIHFIIATRCPVDRASIEVRSIDGRTAGTVDVPSGAPGTHTVHWKAVDASGKKIAPGNYICRVLFDGKAVASRKASIF